VKTRLEVDERRAQLLELGLTRFGKKTYDEVSIDDIAEAAGISKGLLYHYFPTKRAFYAACVREACTRLFAATAVHDAEPGLPELSDSLDAYLDFADEHGPAYLGLMTSGVGVDPEIGGIVEEARAEFVARLTEGLSTALGKTLEGRLAAVALRGFIGMIEASTLAWLKQKDHAKSRAELRDLFIAVLLSMLQMESVK
jgi:AcrR family transcriptional regulator